MMSCASGNSRRLSIKFMCVTLPYMSIGSGVILPVAFQKVYDAPHAEASAQRDYESGQGRDSLTEKCHSVSSLSAAYAAIKIG